MTTRSKTIGAVTAFGAALALTGTSGAALAGGFADLVEDVSPSVVFVEVTASSAGAAREDLPQNDPRFEEFMKRFGDKFPMPNNAEPRQGVGSGFFIAEDGLIVTNHHVIASAESVTVKLQDGTELDATVVGSDPLTDIAILDVEGTDFPAVAFGSSEDIRVGEEVIAVGSPFGLGGTVTSGIVSAKSRNINAGPFDDFIQTDAAVNRGNSGGPLFNTEGEVIGVNTMIFSPGGGSVGIGFAVPSDLVVDIVADLQDDGEVERSWLGVQIKPVTAEIAHVLGLKAGEGVMVEEVVAESPAQKAGLEKGDVILKFNDQEIAELRDLTRSVAMEPAGETSTIEVFRGGTPLTLDVVLAERSAQNA